MGEKNSLNNNKAHVIEYFIDGEKKSKAAENMGYGDIEFLRGEQIVENIAYFNKYCLLEALNALDKENSLNSLSNHMQTYNPLEARDKKYFEILELQPEIISFCDIDFINRNINDPRLKKLLKEPDYVNSLVERIIRDSKDESQKNDLLFKLATTNNSPYYYFEELPFSYVLNKILEGKSDQELKDIFDNMVIDGDGKSGEICKDEELGKNNSRKTGWYLKLLDFSGVFINLFDMDFIFKNLENELVQKSSKFLDESKGKQILGFISNDKDRSDSQKQNLIKQFSKYNFGSIDGLTPEDILDNLDCESVRKYFESNLLDEKKINEILACLSKKNKDEQIKIINKIASFNILDDLFYKTLLKQNAFLFTSADNIKKKMRTDYRLSRIKDSVSMFEAYRYDKFDKFIVQKKDKYIWALYYLDLYGVEKFLSDCCMYRFKNLYGVFKTIKKDYPQYKYIVLAMRKAMMIEVPLQILALSTPVLFFVLPETVILFSWMFILVPPAYAISFDITALMGKGFTPLFEYFFTKYIKEQEKKEVIDGTKSYIKNYISSPSIGESEKNFILKNYKSKGFWQEIEKNIIDHVIKNFNNTKYNLSEKAIKETLKDPKIQQMMKNKINEIVNSNDKPNKEYDSNQTQDEKIIFDVDAKNTKNKKPFETINNEKEKNKMNLKKVSDKKESNTDDLNKEENNL